ncbi:MAG: M56 family metallopeptidase, partial [Porcipelethomonas sp.]
MIWIYVSGVIISLLYHTIGYFHFSRNLKRYSSEITDKELLSVYKIIKDDMFIEKDIPLYLSNKSDSPMLKGVIKPAIFITKQEYSLEEYKMIFRHELTHYQNKDNLKKLFFMFVCVLQWFNPFVYVLAANLSESLECLCDQKIVKNKDSNFKREYSLTLLKTMSTHHSSLVSNLSKKKKMKIRINNIFDNTKKKSSVLPAIAVTLSAVILSSFLCSCTVDVPDDVIEEMNRIESGIDNEHSAESSNSDEPLEITAKPVSEVTAGAKAELDAIASTDGIFKFDNTFVYIPEKDELKIYREEKKYGLDTPQDIYDQLQYLEKEWLGCDVPDEEYTAAIMGDEERTDLTIDEFLEGDNIAAIYNSAEERSCGSIEHFYSSLRLWSTPLMNEIMEENPDLRISSPKETINCQNISKEALSRKFVFSDGEITLSEVITNAEDYMNSFKYTVDEKITYKVETVDVYELKDGSEMLHINLRVMCENSPFVFVYFDVNSGSPFSVTEIDGIDNKEKGFQGRIEV